MEAAAAEANTPEGRAVYDYLRAGAYLDLGRGEDAIRMLAVKDKYQVAQREASNLAADASAAARAATS